MAEKENTRLLILETLLEIEKKNIFVKDALQKLLFQKQFLSKQDRAFITRMVEGVTEYQVQLDYVIDCFSKTKVKKCKPLIRCVLRMGVYQILYMDSVPNEAACNECVKLAKKKGFQNLSGFVNGVLRNISREKDSIQYPEREKDLEGYLSITYSMPVWLVKEMLSWYGEEVTEHILKASVMPSDLTIRVNENRISKEKLRDKLSENGVVVTDGNYVGEALHLANINYVKRLPGFKEGEFFIQDESSMLLYQLSGADREKKEADVLHILDLCAAPGGKCTHFAQKLGDRAFIKARDLTENKISLINENVLRLGIHNIETDVWDALILDESRREWADVVIADLPCSGLGIIAKKNDIKYHISKQQLTELANLQRTILTNAAAYVKKGGILLYSTCTINPEENMENAKWFLGHFDFEKEPIEELLPEELRKNMLEENMVQLLPGVHKCDGFFIAKFRKR
ncbi:MAG: 16S rRNA (cytosine(967)-C(5))-methyltransferase RsmB [Clostridiales bacterium]|nr:16S rRNA (cytosine(967)-C(5))-methyltransferase RsmB [Clostridiales bacterium]